MDPNNDPKTDTNNNPNDYINLELSLGIGPQEQDPVVQPQEQDPVEQQGNFMQLLKSVSYPPPTAQLTPLPPQHMIPFGYYNNVIYPLNVSGEALPPSPPLEVALLPSTSTNLAPAQLVQPPQAIQGGSGASETPRPEKKLGRAPAGNHEIVPPYPWATTKPAQIQNLRYLHSKNIFVISGQVYCKPCKSTQTLTYNLREKFEELHRYILHNKEELRQRAPKVWLSPKLPLCRSCENGMKPVIGDNKEEINWLFLLLGQLLGCCSLEELRYFCHKNNQHRTGAKDRVLYTTYLVLCRQLDPCQLFSL